MSKLLFVDTFDHIDVADLLAKWTQILVAGTGNQAIVAGRTGYALNFPANGGPYVTMPEEYPTFCCGVAYQCTSFANDIVYFSNRRAGAACSAGLRHLGDGRIEPYLQGPNNGAAGVRPGLVMKAYRWYHIGFKAHIYLLSTLIILDYTIYVNGHASVSNTITITAVSNPSLTDPKFASFGLQAPGGGNNATFDDVYLTDGDFLGDSRWYCIRGDNDTAVSGWQGSVTGAHYLLKNKLTPNDDANYLSASGVGDKELEDLEPVPVPGQIVGAQGVWMLEKTEAGVAAVDQLYKTNGSEYNAGTVYPSYGSRIYFLDGQIFNPITSGAWTPSEINALQMGEERSE